MMFSSFLDRGRNKLSAMIRRLLGSQPLEPTSREAHAAAPAPVPSTQAGSRVLRSPEEVRADLARLRATSRERHARVSIERPESFDDAVFAHFSESPVVPAAKPEALDDYPKTVMVPRARGGSKPSP